MQFLRTGVAESSVDIQILKDDKEQAIKAKQEAEQKAGNVEKELKSLEDRREQLQPIMDNVSKEIKEYGTVKTLLPEAGTLERAVTYRDKKIKPLFIQLKNKVAAMAAQVKELTKEVENWKGKYQKLKQKYNGIQSELNDMRKDNQKLSEEKDILQGVSDIPAIDGDNITKIDSTQLHLINHMKEMGLSEVRKIGRASCRERV